jgi:hypothetical protein
MHTVLKYARTVVEVIIWLPFVVLGVVAFACFEALVANVIGHGLIGD